MVGKKLVFGLSGMEALPSFMYLTHLCVLSLHTVMIEQVLQYYYYLKKKKQQLLSLRNMCRCFKHHHQPY